MELVIQAASGSISGSYYYEKIGRPLELNGNISRDEKITMDETDEQDHKTGTFRGQFARSQQTFERTWSSADRKRVFPFKLTRVAGYVSLDAKEERCWSDESTDANGDFVTREGPCSFSFEYPRFLSTSRALHQINTIMQTRAMNQYNQFISAEKNEQEIGKEKNVVKGEEWNVTNAYSIVYYAEDFVSLLVSHNEYAGGIHPLYNFESATFSVKGGNATELKLADFFIRTRPISKCSAIF
jgi:hypothetical protein